MHQSLDNFKLNHPLLKGQQTWSDKLFKSRKQALSQLLLPPVSPVETPNTSEHPQRPVQRYSPPLSNNLRLDPSAQTAQHETTTTSRRRLQRSHFKERQR